MLLELLDDRYQVTKRLSPSSKQRPAVYQVRDLRSDTTVALKLADSYATQLQVEALRNEFLLLSRIHHPYIVRALDFHSSYRIGHYFTMEFVSGDTLEALTQRISTSQVMVVLKQILEAIEHLSNYNALHRDINPKNVLVSYHDNAIRSSLIDFEFAAPPTNSLRCGMLPFIAPEVLKGEKHSIQSDLFSLARTIEHVLLGEVNSATTTRMLSDLPEPFASLLSSMSSPIPGERPATASQALDLVSSNSDTLGAALQLSLQDAPLVGRDALLHSLCMPNSESGPTRHVRPSIFLVEGEDGIGKTRILSEVRLQLQAQGVTTITIHCNPRGSDDLGQLEVLIGKQLPQAIGSPNHDRNSADPQVTLPMFAAHGSRNVAHGFQDGYRIRTQNIVVDSICRFSSRSPLALLVDDIHSADFETLEILRLLSIRPNHPSIIATYLNSTPRPSHLVAFLRYMASRHDSAQKSLERFTPEQTIQYLSHHLSSLASIFDFGDHLHKSTGGNPLLLQEAVTGLFKTRTLSRNHGEWTLDPRWTEKLELPTSLSTFAYNLLETIPHGLRRIIEVVAVHDDAVGKHLLCEILERRSEPLQEDLNQLVSDGILDRINGEFEDGFVFHHYSVGRYTYQSIAPKRRRELHLRIASVIERLRSPMSESILEIVAYHYTEGMDCDRGPRYALLVAQAAMQKHATQRAIGWLNKGLSLVPDRDPRRSELLETIAPLQLLVGNLQQSEQNYFELLVLSRTARLREKEALAVREMGRCLLERGELRRGFQYATEARRLFKILGNDVAETGAMILQAQGFLKMGDLASATAMASAAGERAESFCDDYGLSLVETVKGLIASERGQHQQAVAFHERALSLKSSANDVTGIPVTLSNIGLAYLEHNQVNAAKWYFEESLSRARSMGLSLAGTLSSTNLAEILLLTGEIIGAQALLLEALTLAENANRKYLVAYISFRLGILRGHTGFFSDSLSNFCRADSLSIDAGSLPESMQVLTAKAELLLELGCDQTAREAIQKALEISTQVENPQTLAWARSVSLAIDIEAGRRSSVRVHDADLDEARGSGKKQVLARLLECRTRLLMADGREKDALPFIDEMKTIARESDLRPELGRIALMEGRALLKLQRRVEARLVLEQGATLAREIGLRPLLTRLLYWLSQAQEAEGDPQGAADSLYEADELIESMAEGIQDESIRASYRGSAHCVAVFQRVQRLRRAGVRPRRIAGGAAIDPEFAAAEAFEQVKRSLGADAPLRSLLTAVLDKAIQTIRADRGLVILLDPPSPEVTIARDLEGETIQDATDYCRTILEDVTSGKPILAIDTSQDERFLERRSIALYDIRSLMCLPLKLGESVLGALYFDSRSNDRLFTEDDLRLMETFSERVTAAIADAREAQRQRERTVIVNREFARKYHRDNLIGDSPPMRRLSRMMEAVIRADCNVLVTGESGTGKELVARAIHYGGSRKLNNFVPVDCGAIPESLIESELFGYARGAFSGADRDKKGLLEEAANGTLFLDEVTNTTPAFQAKLLRALQSGEFRRLGETQTRRVDVRIIAATNANIERAIESGDFREDLYYRLNVVTLSLPPLRERRDDILALAEHFGRGYCSPRGIKFGGIDRGALARLKAYAWPGNVRELGHAIEASLVLSGDGVVRREHLPERILGGDAEQVRDLLQEEMIGCNLDGGNQTDERSLLIRALEEAGGDKSRAARLLGWNRMRLYRRMKSLDIPSDTGKCPDPTGSVQ